MLYTTLDLIKTQLNGYFRSSAKWKEDKVTLSGLSKTGPDSSEDHEGIKISLLNICQESTLKNISPYVRNGGDFAKSNPPLSFNIDFILSAHCSDYSESLKLLSDAINFLQGNYYFDHSIVPGLSQGIRKISLSILDTDLTEMSHFWSANGSSYVPSIAYRMRVVVFDGLGIKEEVPRVISSQITKSDESGI